MRYWFALAGVCLSAQVCLSAVNFSETLNGKSPGDNTAFMTQTGQTGTVQANREAETNFGMTWDSVRTFRLSQPASTQLNVYIDSKPAGGTLFRPQHRQYVMDSMRAWSSALNNRVWFSEVDSRQAADITIRWVPSFRDRYVAGITNYRVGHADIEIKTVGIPERDIKANILHEFGHALGIANHSRNPNDIMVAERRWHRGNTAYNPGLSSRDIQAIRRLYSMDWRRGEDLYANAAQSKPATYLATDPASRGN
ncbi:MAG TPA: matrixin family metalloprotease [Coleofasciculaceae cyanobacterium]|jgi:hypothetical protein